MGQYFQFVNIDKKETISPFDFGNNGLKEMEHSYLHNEYTDACVYLLSTRWKGDRVIHLGDYADELVGDDKFKNILDTIMKKFNVSEDNVGTVDNHCKRLTKEDVGEYNKDKPIRYILVDDDFYIDRYDVLLGVEESKTKDNVCFMYETRDNVKHAILEKLDVFALSVSVGEGSGGSYHFDRGTQQDDLHGCLAGHRFSSTDDKNKLNGRTKIDLRCFGYHSIEEVKYLFSKQDIELIIKDNKDILTDEEVKQLKGE